MEHFTINGLYQNVMMMVPRSIAAKVPAIPSLNERATTSPFPRNAVNHIKCVVNNLRIHTSLI
jgi:hypothetical protein